MPNARLDDLRRTAEQYRRGPPLAQRAHKLTARAVAS